MIDSHVHFHKQVYDLKTIDSMVKTALNNNINEICLLDHTHKFREFNPIYSPCMKHIKTWDHFKNKKQMSVNDYLCFIEEVKKIKYPIIIKFGLEVCYFKETEQTIRDILSNYNFDFLIGSIHHINGMAYDINEEFWNGLDVDKLYRQYYEDTKELIKSQLFTHLAHPDAIKRFKKYPTYSLINTYEEIADLLAEYNLPTENNTGFARYGFNKLGLNKIFYNILKSKNVHILKSSDAHKFSMIGYAFSKIKD